MTSTVVGAAIIAHGRVLAARRTRPAELAGGWEFPGGKVEPGETVQEACVREIREELGCEVEVVDSLPGEQPLPGGYALTVVVCELRGDPLPLPTEHDALRWLGPEELDEVPWLEVDRPFLAPLRERLLDGEPLTGGATGGAARIGGTVRRPTGPWSPAVHALLGYLAGAGLDRIPRVLGTDERGREVLTYLPGRPVWVDSETVPDVALVEACGWLRRFHDLVREWRPDGPLVWRNADRAPEDGEIICHNDIAAYNWAIDGDHFAGAFDWDIAGPGKPMDDLAFMAWTGVPLHRESPLPDLARRLDLMAEAYGGITAREILAAVDRRMTTATERIAAGQARGDEGMLNLARIGEPERTRGRVERLRARLPEIIEALG